MCFHDVKIVTRACLNTHKQRVCQDELFTHIQQSHIPLHTRSGDPYVSSLSEKSVPHRYPCEISVTNTR